MKLSSLMVLLLAVVAALGWRANGADCINPPIEAVNSQDFNEIACRAINPNPEEISEIVHSTLKPFLRKTQREISFYSYGDSTGFENPVRIGNSERALSYFRAKAAGYFQTNDQGSRGDNVLGRGLYAAVDPLESLSYAGKKLLLVRITVPPGTAYLDVRDEIDNRGEAYFLPVKESDAQKVWCYLRNSCKDDSCKEDVDTVVNNYVKGKDHWPAIEIREFLLSKEPQRLVDSVYKKMGIEFIAGSWGRYVFPECKLNAKESTPNDAVFVDPEFAPRVKIDALVPQLEANPSPEKRKVYGDVLRYFDAFDVSMTHDVEISGLLTDQAMSNFWMFYQSWAPVIHQISVGTDLKIYQKQLSKKLEPQRHEQLTSHLFGCSKDNKYRDEAYPPGQ